MRKKTYQVVAITRRVTPIVDIITWKCGLTTGNCRKTCRRTGPQVDLEPLNFSRVFDCRSEPVETILINFTQPGVIGDVEQPAHIRRAQGRYLDQPCRVATTYRTIDEVVLRIVAHTLNSAVVAAQTRVEDCVGTSREVDAVDCLFLNQVTEPIASERREGRCHDDSTRDSTGG